MNQSFLERLGEDLDNSEQDALDEDDVQDESRFEEDDDEMESTSEIQESNQLNFTAMSDWTEEYNKSRDSLETADFAEEETLETSQTSTMMYAEEQEGGKGRGRGRGGRGGRVRGRGGRGRGSFSLAIDDSPKKPYDGSARGRQRKDRSSMLMNALKEQEATTILGSRRTQHHKQVEKRSLSRDQRVRSWARVLRPPKPGTFTGFLIPTWVPVQDLTEEEKTNIAGLGKVE